MTQQQTVQKLELRAFKIILVGPQSAGKSSLIYRITESLFNQNYTATIGIDFRTHEVTVAEKSYSLHLWDTAGQEKFRALTSTYYKGSQGCLCVYDISSKESLQRCEYYISKALEEGIHKECIMLVGNKLDISTDQVPGEQVALRYNIQHAVASAKTGQGVRFLFDCLGRKLVEEFGETNSINNNQLKPTVNLQVGRKKCCF